MKRTSLNEYLLSAWVAKESIKRKPSIEESSSITGSSDTCRLSFDYSDFVSIIHALNATRMKFDAPVYIFFIFPENNFL